ncbi:MAG: hypothetical protein HY319_12725 [Armatimonadetes bacterium]|nr:hypothetical protein [Armatimonadota bacterium]
MPRAATVPARVQLEGDWTTPLAKNRMAALCLWSSWTALMSPGGQLLEAWGGCPLEPGRLDEVVGAARCLEDIGWRTGWTVEVDGLQLSACRVGVDYWLVAAARPGCRQTMQDAMGPVADRLLPVLYA